MTYSQLKNIFFTKLKNTYPKTEIHSFFYLLTEEYLDKTRLDFALSNNAVISKNKASQFLNAIEKLKRYEPIQYILGKTRFMDLIFNVSPDVLIPRPETEELINWILSQVTKTDTLTILDIGTGSGCIAISLAERLRNSTVFALDISDKALKIAAKNAIQNGVAVTFINANILNNSKTYWESVLPLQKFDYIVSNPPYVLEKEKALMSENVLKHEPEVALFVPNDDALLFYKHICVFARNHLVKGGSLYFEINETYGNAVIQVLKETGFTSVEKKKDMYGKDRMVRGIK